MTNHEGDRSTDVFLELTFDGGRFDSHCMPVDVLAELATVQRVLEAVARHLYFRQNPDRQRVPRGFVEASHLYLSTSRANCYTAGLSRPNPATWGLLEIGLFDKARALTISALSAVETDSSFPSDFPSDALEDLAAIGLRLSDEEVLSVKDSAALVTARINQKTRAKLALLTSQSLEKVMIIEGEVEEIDDKSLSLQLLLKSKERITVSFKSPDREKVADAFKNRPIARVRAHGLVIPDKKKMKKVEELDVFDDERAVDVQKVWDRLKAFERIPQGWCDGFGIAPSRNAVARAREVLARLLVDNKSVERPKVYPTPQGGVQAEWVLGKWAVDLCFSPNGDSIKAEATHADTGDDVEKLFDKRVVHANDVKPLVDWLCALT